MNKGFKWILWGILIVVLIVYPRLFGIYYTNILVEFGIFALYAISVNLLLGYTGLLTFGHAIFFGVGGYSTALALTHIQGLPLLASLLIGFLSAVLFALILCPMVVRLSGTAFAMLHLAFGLLMYVVTLKLRGITGGEDGIGGFPIPPFSIPGIVSIDMTDPLMFYYFAMIVLVICISFLWFFTKTPFGQIMVGIRDNADRIDYVGFKVSHSKALIYIFAGGFAGVAGSIFALFQNLVSADEFAVLNSFAPIMIIMVGGIASFFGPIFGAGIFALIAELTSRYTERVELVMGLILILVIMYAPMGFLGLVNMARARIFNKEGMS